MPLNVSLGAQKCFREGFAEPGIQFGVYAPNARHVEAVFGLLWKQGDSNKTPVNQSNPAPYEELCGGNVADDGTGIDSALPVIPLLRHDNADRNHPDPDKRSHRTMVLLLFLSVITPLLRAMYLRIPRSARAGHWSESINSDAAKYGGNNLLNAEAIQSEPGRLSMLVPANGIVVLKKTGNHSSLERYLMSGVANTTGSLFPTYCFTRS